MTATTPRWALPVVTILAALSALPVALILMLNGLFGFALSETIDRKLFWVAALAIGLILLAYAIVSIILGVQMARSAGWSRRLLFILQGTAVACVIALLFFGEDSVATLGFALIALLVLTFAQFVLARQAA